MYSKICDLQNIYSAYLKARSCKRYKHEILKYTKDLENQLVNFGSEKYDDLADAFSILMTKIVQRNHKRKCLAIYNLDDTEEERNEGRVWIKSH